MLDIYKFERSRDDFEGVWLKNLLNREYNYFGPYASCEEVGVPEPNNPCLVIVNCHTTHLPFLDKLNKKNINFGVYQTADETLAEQFYYHTYKTCKFIARNYINPHTRDLNKVFHLGLGYCRGYTEIYTNKKSSKREFIWGFVGAVRGVVPWKKNTKCLNTTREDVVEIFKDITPNFSKNIGSGFDHPSRLTHQEYREIMDKCIFAICPYGHSNNDTFRMYEALEAGCIPVALENSPICVTYEPSYWHAIFRQQQEDNIFPFLINKNNIEIIQGTLEKIPFIIEKDWYSCYVKIKYIIQNNLQDEIQDNCKQFWQKYKKYWSHLLDKNIKKLYEN